MSITRRDLLAGAVLGLAAGAAGARYQVGITTNTRGGWEKDVFLSFREAHEAGIHNVESFTNYFTAYFDKPDDLRRPHRRDRRALRHHLQRRSHGDALRRRLASGRRCWTIICAWCASSSCSAAITSRSTPNRAVPRAPTAADLKTMAATFNELGRRIHDEGLKFGVHAHMWTQFENRREIDIIAEATDPKVGAFRAGHGPHHHGRHGSAWS